MIWTSCSRRRRDRTEPLYTASAPMQNAPNTEDVMRYLRSALAAAGLAAFALLWAAGPSAQQKSTAEKSNMELVGYSDLQGRSAYQPLVHKQGDRFIAYIGHHGGSTL